MSATYAILLSAIAFLIGCVITWFIGKYRSRIALDTLRRELGGEMASLSQEKAQLQERASRIPELIANLQELERTRDELIRQDAEQRETAGRVSAELASERDTLAAAKEELRLERIRRESENEALSQARLKLTETSTQLEAQKKLTEELKAVRESLGTHFQNLANEILDEKSKKFTEQNRANLGLLLDPLRTKLTEFQSKVESVYDKETRDRTALSEQVRQLMGLNQSLSEDAKNLTSALRGSNKAQGTWGELILERVLESSGLRRGEEYHVQESHTNEDGGRSQPDVTIHLPEDRHLVVDAKVSLTAYEEFASSDNEEEKDRALRRHLESVRSHMRGLSGKNYQQLYGISSLDFVLMFVPVEPAFMLAVTNDRSLFMDGWQRNVLLVSPSTLLFVVRTVAHLWRQEAQSRNAQEIAKRGAELYDRLCSFVTDLEKVGDRISQAQDSFNDAKNKLTRNKGNVIRQAEMLKSLGVKPTKTMASKLVEISMDADDELNEPDSGETSPRDEPNSQSVD